VGVVACILVICVSVCLNIVSIALVDAETVVIYTFDVDGFVCVIIITMFYCTGIVVVTILLFI
jgi:hypothetical protein